MKEIVSVLTICQDYADEKITREELVELLSIYPYTKESKTDGYDWITVDSSNTWAEITHAIDLGLIEETVYEDVFCAIHGEEYRMTDEEREATRRD